MKEPTSETVSSGLKVAHVEAPVTEENSRRTKSGKFTLAQLRQTDGIVPLQSGTNQFDSQKGKTGFGMPRNTSTNVQFKDTGKKWTIEQLRATDSIIRLQSGTNRCDSQKGMTGFGMPRDVRGKHLKRLWELEFPEEAFEHIEPSQPSPAAAAHTSQQNNQNGVEVGSPPPPPPKPTH